MLSTTIMLIILCYSVSCSLIMEPSFALPLRFYRKFQWASLVPNQKDGQLLDSWRSPPARTAASRSTKSRYYPLFFFLQNPYHFSGIHTCIPTPSPHKFFFHCSHSFCCLLLFCLKGEVGPHPVEAVQCSYLKMRQIHLDKGLLRTSSL